MEAKRDVSFVYSGTPRVVRDAVVKPVEGEEGAEILVGREIRKDGLPVDDIKAYRMDRIEGDIREVAPVR